MPRKRTIVNRRTSGLEVATVGVRISEALQCMVEDRRTDLTLEQIEQAAAEEESQWDD
jgi:hypothetical protein